MKHVVLFMNNVNKFAVIVTVVIVTFGVGFAVFSDMITNSPIDYQKQVDDGIVAGSDPFEKIAENVKDNANEITIQKREVEKPEVVNIKPKKDNIGFASWFGNEMQGIEARFQVVQEPGAGISRRWFFVQYGRRCLVLAIAQQHGVVCEILLHLGRDGDCPLLMNLALADDGTVILTPLK